MEVHIARDKRDCFEFIFHGWDAERNRMARIEIDILKRVACISTGVREVDGKKVYVISRDAPLDGFDRRRLRDVIGVLDEYCVRFSFLPPKGE